MTMHDVTLTRPLALPQVALRRIVGALFAADALYRQKRALKRLDGARLADIGLSARDAGR